MATSDLSDFKARLGLDSSPVEDGFKKVELKAGLLDKVFQKVGLKFGQSLGLDNIINKLGGSFANKFIGIFAAGAVASGIKNAIAGTISAAIDEAVGIDKLQKQFSKFGFSARDIQALQDESNRSGDTIQRITEDAKRLKSVLEVGPKGFVIIPDDEVKAFAELAKLAERLEMSFRRIASTFFGGHAQITARNPAGTVAQALAGLVGSGPAGLGTLHGAGVGATVKNLLMGPDKTGGQLGGNKFLSADQVGLIEAKIKKITDLETKRQSEINDKSFKLMDERASVEKQIAELGETNGQKRARLEREITELKEKQINFQASPILREQFKLDEARARLELGQIKDPKLKLEALKGDSLTSVGNFLGSDPSRSSQAVTHKLDMIHATLKEISKQSSVGGLRGAPVPMQ